MQVIHYSDLSGNQYREIRSRSYRELVELGGEYKKRGANIWVNLYDGCEGIWMLTVLEKKVA